MYVLISVDYDTVGRDQIPGFAKKKSRFEFWERSIPFELFCNSHYQVSDNRKGIEDNKFA